MMNSLTQIIEGFLGDMSQDAKEYFFPGSDKELHHVDAYFDHDDCLYDVIPGEDSLVHHAKACMPGCFEPRPERKFKPKRLFSRIIPRQDVEEEPEPPVADLEPDEKTKAILAEIDALQKKYGISIHQLEVMLSYRVELSHLRITRKKEILMEDFDRKEVRMDTLTKAVFLLYLNHPEGIRYKELSDHQRELEKIYSSITGREDVDRILKSVEDLCDPLNNSINEKVSKVKKAFRDVVDDRVARFYYIDGGRATAKRIALDRSLVLWE